IGLVARELERAVHGQLVRAVDFDGALPAADVLRQRAPGNIVDESEREDFLRRQREVPPRDRGALLDGAVQYSLESVARNDEAPLDRGFSHAETTVARKQPVDLAADRVEGGAITLPGIHSEQQTAFRVEWVPMAAQDLDARDDGFQLGRQRRILDVCEERGG